MSKKMGLCSANRFKNILLKGNFKKYKEIMRQDRSVLSNFDSTTDEYLKDRINENA